MVRRVWSAVVWLGGLALCAMGPPPVAYAATVASASVEPVLAPNGCAVAVRYRWTVANAVAGHDEDIMVQESLPLLADDWLERLESRSLLARPRIDGRPVPLSEPADLVVAREGTSLVLTFSVGLPHPVAPARLAVDLQALKGSVLPTLPVGYERLRPAETTEPSCQ